MDGQLKLIVQKKVFRIKLTSKIKNLSTFKSKTFAYLRHILTPSYIINALNHQSKMEGEFKFLPSTHDGNPTRNHLIAFKGFVDNATQDLFTALDEIQPIEGETNLELLQRFINIMEPLSAQAYIAEAKEIGYLVQTPTETFELYEKEQTQFYMPLQIHLTERLILSLTEIKKSLESIKGTGEDYEQRMYFIMSQDIPKKVLEYMELSWSMEAFTKSNFSNKAYSPDHPQNNNRDEIYERIRHKYMLLTGKY